MAIQLDKTCRPKAPADTVKLLGEALNLHLNMNSQVNNVSRTCNYHLHQIGKIRKNILLRKHVKRQYSH